MSLDAARRAAIAVSVALCLALPGCSLFSDSDSAAPAPRASAAACPTTSILQALSNTAVFAAEPRRGAAGRTQQEVAFYGILSNVESSCAPEPGGLRVKLDVIVIGERGPAARGDGVDLDYFVAVTRPDQSILDKKRFAVHIAFEGNQKRAGVTDHIEMLVPEAGARPADLTILVGFQQSPEAVEFYRRGGAAAAR